MTDALWQPADFRVGAGLIATQPLDATTWLTIVLLAAAVFVAVEAEKALLRRIGVRDI